MRISNQPLVLQPTAVTTTFTSKAIWLGHIANYAIQLSYAGAAVGVTVKLQASCDEGATQEQAQANVERQIVNYTDVAGSSKTLTATTADTLLYDVSNAGYNWVRVVITGAVNISALRFNVKGV